MARIYTGGFELNSSVSGMDANGIVGGQFSTTTVRTGTYSYRNFSLSSGASERCRIQFSASVNTGPWYFRAYFRPATFPSAENRVLIVNDSATVTTTNRIYLTLDSGGLLRLYDEDGQIGSASSALLTGTWYRVEIMYDLTGAAGSHVVRARLDGVEFASATNRDIASASNQFWVGGNLANEANTAGDWFWDDLAINNSSGSFQNSYPGAGSVYVMRPNAAGDNADWTRGGADSGANWSQADEVTPNDATDYISSNTLNQIDDYNLEAAPAAMQSNDVINVVTANARFSGAAASSNASFVPRIKATASGTVEEGSSTSTGSTTWRTNDSAGGVLTPKLTLYDLPGASTTAWTKADLADTQVGVRLSATSTNAAQVSAIWLTVEAAPFVASATKNLGLLGVG